MCAYNQSDVVVPCDARRLLVNTCRLVVSLTADRFPEWYQKEMMYRWLLSLRAFRILIFPSRPSTVWCIRSVAGMLCPMVSTIFDEFIAAYSTLHCTVFRCLQYRLVKHVHNSKAQCSCVKIHVAQRAQMCKGWGVSINTCFEGHYH